jgi:hypothetical protein
MSIREKEIVRVWKSIIKLLVKYERSVVLFPVRSTASGCTAAVTGYNIKRVQIAKDPLDK